MFWNAYSRGALQLVKDCEFSSIHADCGFSKRDWQILTQREYWNAQQTQSARGLVNQAVTASLTLGNLPAMPLPAEFVVATIVVIVAPRNRLVAVHIAPDCYDASQVMSGDHGAGSSTPPSVSRYYMQSLLELMSSDADVQIRDAQREAEFMKMREAQRQSNV